MTGGSSMRSQKLLFSRRSSSSCVGCRTRSRAQHINTAHHIPLQRSLLGDPSVRCDIMTCKLNDRKLALFIWRTHACKLWIRSGLCSGSEESCKYLEIVHEVKLAGLPGAVAPLVCSLLPLCAPPALQVCMPYSCPQACL